MFVTLILRVLVNLAPHCGFLLWCLLSVALPAMLSFPMTCFSMFPTSPSFHCSVLCAQNTCLKLAHTFHVFLHVAICLTPKDISIHSIPASPLWYQGICSPLISAFTCGLYMLFQKMLLVVVGEGLKWWFWWFLWLMAVCKCGGSRVTRVTWAGH